ncbi:MAG: molybdopterin-dependent oxidoreductase [Stackebrandtia sp.]
MGWKSAALCGVAAAVVAVGVGAIVAAATFPRAAPLSAVGDVVIVWTPESLKQWAIETFGQADKLVLQGGTIVLLAAFAAGVGVASRKHLVLGFAGIGVFTALGAAAAATRAGASPPWVVPSLCGGAAAAAILWGLPRLAGGGTGAEEDPRTFDRRRFLIAAGGAIGVAGLGGFIARSWGQSSVVEEARSEIALPAPADPAPRLPADVDLDVPQLSSWTTPNEKFYRIDTALTTPNVVPDDYRLRIFGDVERELTLTYDDLLSRPLVERDITLCCVSNEVGGNLVGNARWLGVPVADLLDEVAPGPGADQLVSRSADGWTAGSPTELCRDGRDALVAVGMNGEPLPVEHGFPVRMVVPGLYGYVSATKWLVELELTSFDAFDAYWIGRGWSTPSPIKTQSRIDTPRGSASAGKVAVAGVAWAQHRGIEAVEVRVDGGPWNAARLSDVPSTDTWRQWVWEWDAEPGDYSLTVRAVDGDDETQTEQHTPVQPNGASGWHTINVTVE